MAIGFVTGMLSGMRIRGENPDVLLRTAGISVTTIDDPGARVPLRSYAALEASFQANLLDLPIRRDDAALESFLQGGPETLTMPYRRDRETVRLVQEGSSFRAIKDALRRDIALARLEWEKVPVSQVAHDLGFTDTSAFFRAFRKWTGQGPSKYRSRLHLNMK